MSSPVRRIVITGVGIVSPLGNSKESFAAALANGQSGVKLLTLLAPGVVPIKVAAEATAFTGDIENFGPLDKEQKKAIRKGLKVMCRECQMGVAAAQLALSDAGIQPGKLDPDRTGVSYGTDYMLSVSEEFNEGIHKCVGADGAFQMPRWGGEGLPKMSPLWLLKYLPNMPASHVAIYNDLRGPNNSITLREAGANLAIGEAYQIILRGNADAMLCGATGTRLHSMKIVHAIQQEEVACGNGDPATVSRPFDAQRSGMVLGEGAGAIMLEELSHARARGATILGEIVAAASRSAASSPLRADRTQALVNVLKALLDTTGAAPQDIGHLNAHGLSTRDCDADEAQAICRIFGARATTLPIAAAKSYFGNLGAGSGIIELIGSLLSLQTGSLFRTLNYETPDPACPIRVAADDATPSGDSFIKLSITPQGQASGIMVKRFTE